MQASSLAITARIHRRTASRGKVLEWEDRRIDRAAKKLGITSPEAGEVARRRDAFVEAKLAIGAAEIRRRLSRDTQLADRIARAGAASSARRRVCCIDLEVPGVSAAQFVQWYEEMTFSSDETQMMRACPDHFVLRMTGGVQEVLETNGGSPLAALFTIDYDDVSSLVTAIDPQFDYRLDGVARASNGAAIGGVRHQFRDTASGTLARLVVEFPLLTPQRIVSGHRWHLACEFSNWFEAAASA